jgi:hypothetical protein
MVSNCCAVYESAIENKHPRCLERLFESLHIPFTEKEVKLCVENDSESCFYVIKRKLETSGPTTLALFACLHRILFCKSPNHLLTCEMPSICTKPFSLALVKKHFLSIGQGDMEPFFLLNLRKAMECIRSFDTTKQDFMTADGIMEVLKCEKKEAEFMLWMFINAYSIMCLESK